MASIAELLEKLTTKEASVSTADLAKELKASKEGTLKQLTREKEKGNVEGNSQEGWLITDTGRKALEKGDTHPTMMDEGVTPRQQFEAIGRRIGIPADRIVLATDIVWSGEYNDVKWVWEALGQANIADDLRGVWVNVWRAKLHKAIPPELETELTGVSKAVVEAEGASSNKPSGRDYIIDDDMPAWVGKNRGDFTLQDAKDVLSIRALRSRFKGAGQAGTSQEGVVTQPGATEKVSELLTALEPYINKGSDQEMLKELLTTQMELQETRILSKMPQQGPPIQQKTWAEQVAGLATAIASFKESVPMIKSILGIPESSGNPGPAALPVQMIGADGKPIIMDLSNFISLKKFEGEERRADERQKSLTEGIQTAKEQLPDVVQAVLAAVEESKAERKGGAKAPPPEQRQMYKCGNPECGAEFPMPAGEWLEVACPQCGKTYTREEVLGA